MEVSPFTWDRVSVRVTGLPSDRMGNIVAPWFFAWCDTEDRNPISEEGLYGVTHFISELEQREDAISFSADLGSAPVVSLIELVARLADSGAISIRIS